MKEEKKKGKEQGFHEKKQEEKKKPEKQEEREEMLIRILSTDIPANKSTYAGLTRIKGVSWSFSNAACRVLGLDKNKKIKDLTEKEIEIISGFIKKPALPNFIINRRKDIETGEQTHLIGTEVDLQEEFDIKRLKEIKSYKGLRHATGQPVRGQRTRAHFRHHKTVGVVGKGKAKKSGK